MQARTFGVVLLAAILSSSSVALGQQTGATRRLAVVPAPVGPEGKVEELYTESRALLIGVSRYDQGAAWPTLDSVSGELNDLKAALLGLGFDGVEQLVNPTGPELRRGVEGFIARYGYSPRARLVFYFSGHGYTLDSGRRGYFVPRDAPDPTRNEGGFRSVALSMDQVMTWARDLTARHVLFAFDSCFSGTVFRTREATVPKPISDLTAKRVRQFLSAGDAGEPVPARSVFTPTFVRALRGEADLDSDGFITGTELGNWVQRQVLGYKTGQTPQFGKLRDQDFDEGDLVFVAPAPRVANPATAKPSSASATTDGDLGRREELALWDAIKDSTSVTVIEDYLRQYPSGRFTVVAKDRLTRLRAGGGKLPSAPPAPSSVAAPSFVTAPATANATELSNASIETLTADCERRNWNACTESALRYANGRGVLKDLSRGAALFQRACEGGDVRACNGWGYMFESGSGVTKDERRAAELYQTACEGGRALGCSRWGRLFDTGRGVARDDARALSLYQRGCDGGDPEGCTGLGLLHETGRAVAKDETRAVGLYQRGCDAGDPVGCVNFGRMNRFGRGVAKDEPKAVASFQRACELGDPRGCSNWGVMNQQGRGVTVSEERAAALYLRGCDGGDGFGCTSLGVSYEFGRGVKQDFTRAAEAYQRACEAGDADGCVNLAEAYQRGSGVSKDEARALGLFRKGCDAGSARGCTNAGATYRDGRGVAKDLATGRQMFQRACDGGDVLGCANAGVQILPVGVVKVAILDRETRDTTFSSNALAKQPLSYRVKGATFTLRLPDERLVVVDCDSKYALKGDYVNRRSCRMPSAEPLQVEFERDEAKLAWPVSGDGTKMDSETYKVLSVSKKP